MLEAEAAVNAANRVPCYLARYVKIPVDQINPLY